MTCKNVWPSGEKGAGRHCATKVHNSERLHHYFSVKGGETLFEGGFPRVLYETLPSQPDHQMQASMYVNGIPMFNSASHITLLYNLTAASTHFLSACRAETESMSSRSMVMSALPESTS